MIVEPLSDEKEWEDFVAKSPQGTFYHTLAWRNILEKCFNVKPHYLVVRDSNREMIGLCPFVIRKELALIRVLDSLSYSDYGGPLCAEGLAKPVVQALVQHLQSSAKRMGITYAIVHFSDEEMSKAAAIPGSRLDTSHGVMKIDLEDKPPEIIWNDILRAEERKRINRIRKGGYLSTEVTTAEDMGIFYELYRQNILHIGAIPYVESFFQELFQSLHPTNFHIILLTNQDRAIGGMGFFVHEPSKTVHVPYMGLDRTARYDTINYSLIWELLKWTQGHGYRRLNMGSNSSDPQEVHHKQKAKFGLTFGQDYSVMLPLNRRAFLLREYAFRMGRFVVPKLPERIRQSIIESALK
ncbi:MAG: GNAT family N-acetyltransferase [Dehalococcoidia bacterium]|nr:GNAT family N-acetyltransferase [Dehalococcoidia bacterium]